MRQIYIVDSVGSTFTFNHLTKALFTDIEGVGIDRENKYLNFGDTYKLAEKKNPIGSITGKIIFLNGYEGYTEFLNFLKNNKGDLRLFYKADNLKYTYVELVSLTKTELESGVLQCSIKFDKLSMWLSRLSNTIKVKESTVNKQYPYTYPYTYSISFVGSIDCVNAGCKEAPIRIEITGKTHNPVVQIINKEKEVISQMRLLLTTSNSDDVIIVNAIPTEQEMTLNVNGNITDIYGLQDFNCDNFLTLPIGNYTIKFDPGVTEMTKCKITYIEMYEGN